MSNVAIMIGSKTLYLNEKSIDRYAYIGAAEINAMVIGLCNQNPQNQYYLISKCGDSTKQKTDKSDIPANLHFIVDDKYRVTDDEMTDRNKVYAKLDKLVSELKQIGIDYGILMSPLTQAHIPFSVLKKDKQDYCKPLESHFRGMYANYIINQMNFPYITWNTDDRYIFNNGSSVTRQENVGLGFSNFSYTSSLFVDLEKQTQINNIKHTVNVPIIYNYCDPFMLLTKNFVNFDRNILDIENKKEMLLFVNPMKTYDRYTDLQNYVLQSNFPVGVSICGDWHKDKPQTINDPRFKGKLPQNELTELLKTSKYSFILPSWYPNKPTPCTAKYWECVFYKVIPFLHKNYGETWWKNTHNIPDFLWVTDGNNLINKINYLENNPEEYKKLLNQVEATLKPEYLTFEFYNNVFKNAIENNCGVKW